MRSIVKTPSGTWRAVIRKTGFAATIKTFRLKKGAEDRSRRAEDEMVPGMFVKRGASDRLTFKKAMEQYLAEVTPTKRPLTQVGEQRRSLPLIAFFGQYALAAVTAELVAQYRGGHRLVQGGARSCCAPQGHRADLLRRARQRRLAPPVQGWPGFRTMSVHRKEFGEPP